MTSPKINHTNKSVNTPPLFEPSLLNSSKASFLLNTSTVFNVCVTNVSLDGDSPGNEFAPPLLVVRREISPPEPLPLPPPLPPTVPSTGGTVGGKGGGNNSTNNKDISPSIVIVMIGLMNN